MPNRNWLINIRVNAEATAAIIKYFKDRGMMFTSLPDVFELLTTQFMVDHNIKPLSPAEVRDLLTSFNLSSRCIKFRSQPPGDRSLTSLLNHAAEEASLSNLMREDDLDTDELVADALEAMKGDIDE